MLLQMQINMLAHAAKIDMQHIVTIYKISLQHNDFDTADYILKHYKHKFNAAQIADVEAFVFATVGAVTQST
jgi:uncharacterized FlgJ-related protein